MVVVDLLTDPQSPALNHTHLLSSAGEQRSFSDPVLEAAPEALPLLCPCWRVNQFNLHPSSTPISVSPPKESLGLRGGLRPRVEAPAGRQV